MRDGFLFGIVKIQSVIEYGIGMKFVIWKGPKLAFLAIVLVSVYALFLKSFFPMKQGLSGYANDDDVPKIPGSQEIAFPIRSLYKRLTLMIIDALRDDFIYSAQNYVPVLKKLNSEGKTLNYVAQVNPPTVTLPRIKALTTGGIPGFVDVVLNFGSSSLQEDNLMTQLKMAGKKLIFFGDDTWIKLFPHHFDRADGTTSFFVTDYTEVDNNVTHHLPEELAQKDWDVMVLHYLGLDHIGHLAGPRSPLVIPKLLEMDSVISKIYEAMEEWSEPSLLVICGDHGMSDQGGHGGASKGETTVPVIFVSPSLKVQTGDAAKGDDVPDSVLQIDIAPTLSVLLGVSIPKNNLGQVITSTLIGYSVEEMVRTLQVNAHQVSQILEKNVPSFDKEKGYQLYTQAVRQHLEWQTNLRGNLSDASWEKFGHHLISKYQHALHVMTSRISETSSNYDLYGMGVAVFMLWLTLLHLASAGFISSPCIITFSSIETAFMVIFLLPAIFSHVTICTSQHHSDILCGTDALFISIQILLFVLFVGFFLLVRGIFAVLKSSDIKQKIYSMTFLEKAFVAGLIVHTVSLLSSSFVEEEHQTWYFYIITLHLIFLLQLLGSIFKESCPAVKKLAKNQRKQFSEDCNNSVACSDHRTKTECQKYIEDSSHNRSKGKMQQEHFEVELSVKAIGAVFGVLGLCCVLRRLNQTGDKWLNVPDIGDWLIRPENKPVLSISVVVSMATFLITRCRLKSPLEMCLCIAALITTYCFRAANGAVLFPAVYDGVSKGINEARLSYGVVAVLCVETVTKWWQSSMDLKQAHTPFRNTSALWNRSQTIWLTLMILLLRPHNIILVAMISVIEYLICHILQCVNLRVPYLALYCVWLGQACFFYQGNSNSLTTVDVSAGYIGLDNYQPLLIGLLMCLSTYAGPIFWLLSLLKYINMTSVDKADKSASSLRLQENYLTAAISLLLSRTLPLAVYIILVSVERYHLFVWTVFSPKLLYEGMTTVVVIVFCLGFIIMSYFACRFSTKAHSYITSRCYSDN